jgi:lyso-ornithine lipid O-acyltransferase
MMGMVHAGKHVGRGLLHALAELGAVRLARPSDPAAAAHRLAGALGAIARAHDLDVRVRGEPPRGPALIVGNHVSYLDPIAVLPVCPAIPLAKDEVAGWPIVGAIASGLGVVFVDRGAAPARVAVLRRVHDVLAAGASVLNFPEGTTTRGARVLPFWRGTFGVAQRLGIPVVPLALRYEDPEMAWCDRATFLPHYWRTVRQVRVRVELRFGAPMDVRPGERAEALAARAHGAITTMLDSMRWIDAGPRVRLSAPRPDPVLPPAARG